MNFKKVKKVYRPVPFWSWNDELSVKETVRQVKDMNKKGLGGFMMHARGGLSTEYMSEDWFKNIGAATSAARKKGMFPFAYDENGWPSGCADDGVSSLGVEYQQKYLRVADENIYPDRLIAKVGERYFYYDVNPFYVDNLDKKVVSEFIKKAYVPYKERFGTEIEGFFTDEPQLSRDGIPWSFVLEDEFKSEYGENLLPHLPELFFDEGDYRLTRVMFWRLITKLFCNAYFKQIYDWCEENGYIFTGHALCEEFMKDYITSSGAVMPCYRYFHIPGMDWLGRDVFDCLTVHQLGSVAAQFDKKQVLSETFALCGHNVTFSELKYIYNWQMVRGVNLLCQHLQGYSNKGIRKRDYPPAMYKQQPWWEIYGEFNDTVSRESMLMTGGKNTTDLLVLHPLATAWSVFSPENTDGVKTLDEKLIELTRELEMRHIGFHFGDDTVLEENATVRDGKIVIGEMAYSELLIPDFCDVILPSTAKLITEFKNHGGRVVTLDDLSSNDIIDNQNIVYTERVKEGYSVYMFLNTSDTEQKAFIKKGNLIVDTQTGETGPFGGKVIFPPHGAVFVIDNGEERRFSEPQSNLPELPTAGEWTILDVTENSLTLDYCRYFFDGELIEENGYILNVGSRALSLLRPVDVTMEFGFNVKTVPQECFLALETPEKFDICVNDKKVKYSDRGYFIDGAIRKTDISSFIEEGYNSIVLKIKFTESAKTYENVKNCAVFEGVVNRLSLDTEIEPIYIVGNFGVYAENKFEDMSGTPSEDKNYTEKGAYKTVPGFYIDRLPEKITLKNIEQQGFLFFAGNMTLTKDVYCDDMSSIFKINPKGINAVDVSVGGTKKTLMFEPFYLSPRHLSYRQNTATLKLYGNLRNCMGPFHTGIGDCTAVCPSTFYKEKSLWSWGANPHTDDNYIFMERSL